MDKNVRFKIEHSSNNIIDLDKFDSPDNRINPLDFSSTTNHNFIRKNHFQSN
jgi:hypothetical protein